MNSATRSFGRTPIDIVRSVRSVAEKWRETTTATNNRFVSLLNWFAIARHPCIRFINSYRVIPIRWNSLLLIDQPCAIPLPQCIDDNMRYLLLAHASLLSCFLHPCSSFTSPFLSIESFQHFFPREKLDKMTSLARLELNRLEKLEMVNVTITKDTYKRYM